MNSEIIIGQTLSWKWAQSGGGEEFERAAGIKSDLFGNSYVTGNIYSITTTFGPYILNNADPSGMGSDAFLAKYDPTGNIEWIKGIGGIGYEYGNAVTIDNLGFIYVTGSFASPLVNLGNDSLTNSLSEDAFIIKCDSSGNVIWARSISSTSQIYGVKGISIATDLDRNVYITGSSSGTMIFGNDSIENPNNSNFYVAKFDSSGNPIWARVAGNWGGEEGVSISTDIYSNVYVAGYFTSDTLIFANDTLFQSDTINAGNRCSFMVKYDPSGNIVYLKQIEGRNSISSDIVVSSTGYFYWTGSFLDSSILDGALLTAELNSGIYIAKYSLDGTLDWVTSPHGAYAASCNGLSLDHQDNLYITGDFDTGPIIFGSTTLTRSQYSNLYIAKYDSSGQAAWAIKLSGGNEISGRGVSNDAIGDVYFTGYFRSSILLFDSLSVTNTLFGSSDVFVAKFHESSVSVEELLDQNKIIVYPNPSNEEIQIEYLGQINSLLISDIFGRIVYQSKNKEQGQKVKLLHPGIYILQVNIEGREYFTKVLIQ